MRVMVPPRSVPVRREGLVARAQKVLHRNDMGGWTRAAPELYPHQWSWDSAFIAIGLAHLDTRRAGARESFRASVEDRQGAPHRLQPRGAAGKLLPRPRSLCRGLSRRPACAALHELSVPATGPRHRRPPRLGGGQEQRGRGGCSRAGFPAGELPQALALAPIPPDLQGPRGVGAHYYIPSVGEWDRQLAPVGYAPCDA